jgi:hypothetical protein
MAECGRRSVTEVGDRATEVELLIIDNLDFRLVCHFPPLSILSI